MTMLKHRKITVDTYKVNVAYLPRNCSLYHSELLSVLAIHAERKGREIS